MSADGLSGGDMIHCSEPVTHVCRHLAHSGNRPNAEFRQSRPKSNSRTISALGHPINDKYSQQSTGYGQPGADGV